MIVTFLALKITNKMPLQINKVPRINDKVRASFKKKQENSSPVTGTPNIDVEMKVLDKRLLAPFTAQKQNAVARGPR